ncbi:hypothetical protein GLYMA_13G152508v4 [Glycine max]|uniref:uncharacterized protein n=1 Tax=Glycine max TaxID=3847 RepID=UPI00029633B7|nr:uncharacterized protein LOC102665503 [Glycine max]XP_014619686.1 uncharacterized protein LOC102665503 [Glycine max]XP_014619687.1 uncharacterized protein LOC102665503 [Glycine max]KAG4383763.1 hypothetical protein GLYMA_13G152508v4 [Glycine max]KAG4383767.1 hypothetical protein GLYMA_13G152508v4 [Glycine max]KAG4383769.1 hypothetical protein GLYMA_13G152508v4 [Glycine max]|eukprot:XP_006594204.1 uncharacterized protein LOC102665503 [Glycine max]
MSARSAVTRISKSERTSWFTEDSTERNDCQSTAAATPVCFAWWKIRSKEFAALRTARSAPSCRGFVPLSLRYNFLMCQYRDKEAPKLTESGFQFLLMDTNAQLWYIIREYISNSEIEVLMQLTLSHSCWNQFSWHRMAYSSPPISFFPSNKIYSLKKRVEYQLPNLIVGAITKESLYSAFENVIVAEQLVKFLLKQASVDKRTCDIFGN